MRIARIAIWAVIAVGCYGPSAPSGAPCDPEIGNCPGDQVCRAEGSVFTCGAPLALDASPDTIVDTPPIVDGPNGTMRFTYTASIAECASTNLTDPQYCRSVNGQTQLVVDEKDTSTNQPWYAFVRFDLGGDFSGMKVDKVTLRVVATTNSKARGPNTGDVWRVSAFSLQTLQMNQLPSKQGTSKLAGTQGPVVEQQVIEWPLASGVVQPNQPVYLGIYLTTNDGVNYWNTDGPEPPTLVIDTKP